MAAPARADLVGQTLLGKLKVLRVLGAGGMGTVYEVEHLITRHHRALKILHPQHDQSPETLARFIREAGVAGTLRTPYVVETFDAGTLEDGSAYVLMELLRGQTLTGIIETASPEPAVGRMVGLAAQVLEGLAVAHRAGIVHRDIKPDNVFVVRDEQGRERVKLLDFGISKFTRQPEIEGTLTRENMMMGTPYYMSPEQALGAKDVDARADLYAVGVILYEALSGRRPFDDQTLAALVIKLHRGDCEPLHTAAPHVSPGLAAIVHKAMSPERTQRYGSAREMLAALVPHADSSYVVSLETIPSSSEEGPVHSAITHAETLLHSDVQGSRGVDSLAPTRIATDAREISPETSRDPVTREVPGQMESPGAGASERRTEPRAQPSSRVPWIAASVAIALMLLMALGLSGLSAGSSESPSPPSIAAQAENVGTTRPEPPLELVPVAEPVLPIVPSAPESIAPVEASARPESRSAARRPPPAPEEQEPRRTRPVLERENPY